MSDTIFQGNLFDVFNPDVVEVKKSNAFVPDASAVPKRKIGGYSGSKVILVPNLSIYPSKIVQYNTYEGLCHNDKSDFNLKQNNPDGTISQKASVRIKNAISWLTHLSRWSEVQDKKNKKKFRFKINFITLTLPSPQVKEIKFLSGKIVPFSDYHKIWKAVQCGCAKVQLYETDKEIKANYLDQFLEEMRKKYHVKHYVWRAESQANGSIHFHITLNKFIYYGELRDLWNRILDKGTFIKRYHDKFVGCSFEKYCEIADPQKNKSFKKLMQAYQFGLKTNWYSPNTTDVHSVKNIRNIEAYLGTYFTKEDTARRLIQGYLWRLSQSLSRLQHAHCLVDSGIRNELSYFHNVFKTSVKPYLHATILYIPIQKLFDEIQDSRIVQYFEDYKNKILELNPIKI